jgi:TolB-like protein/Flp pilus assembly protein TadD
MSDQSPSEPKFEIGHVLFIDIVGYSKLLLDEQKERLRELTEIVLATPQVTKAKNEQLVRLPTGDGMALVFRNSSEEPAQCALEIARALREHPDVLVRMGIHSGPVSEVIDVSGRTNIAGAGINMAQRVMDCGDAGHILLSKRVADDLAQYRHWQPLLHELGDTEVKHGVRAYIVNFYRDGVGNPALPNKFRLLRQRRTRARWAAIAAALLFLSGIIVAVVLTSKKSATSVSAAPGKSIAVLPFVNMSADKNDEYLSDGMTEELINVLAKVPGLRVPGRTSCFAFKGKNEEDIFRKVGDQLHVGTVLEGSVRKAGDNLRVTAQLINVSDGYHLWSKDYDGDVKDILNFQSNVAEQVVQALQVQLGTEAARALSKKPTENAEAYRLYLLGRYHFAKFTRVGWTNAIHYFEQALQIDPAYTLAYCGLADTYGWAGGQTLPGREAWAKEMEFAQKALALDPNLAEAHLSMGTALYSVLGPYPSEKELDRAAELNPNLPLIYDQYGWTFSEMGQFNEAIAAEKKALELDPLNTFLNTDLAFFLYWARRYEEAITQIRKTLELDPNNAFAHSILGWCLIWKGSKTEARAEFQKATTLDDLPWYVGSLGYACAVSGDRAKAEQILRELEDLAKQRYVSPANRASVYLGLGENEKALDWLEKAYEDRDPIFWWINGDQLYDSVRQDPRFEALFQKVVRTKAESKE